MGNVQLLDYRIAGKDQLNPVAGSWSGREIKGQEE
jgi:hypothetical protein